MINYEHFPNLLSDLGGIRYMRPADIAYKHLCAS